MFESVIATIYHDVIFVSFVDGLCHVPSDDSISGLILCFFSGVYMQHTHPYYFFTHQKLQIFKVLLETIFYVVFFVLLVFVV